MARPVGDVEILSWWTKRDRYSCSSTDVARRRPMSRDWSGRSVARRTFLGGETVASYGGFWADIYDVARSLGRDTAVHNMDFLGIYRSEIISNNGPVTHGHVDHHHGLEGLFRRIGRCALPFVTTSRCIVWNVALSFPQAQRSLMPPASRQDLDREGWGDVLEGTGEKTHILPAQRPGRGDGVGGSSTSKGMPIQYAHISDSWQVDPFISLGRSGGRTSMSGQETPWWYPAASPAINVLEGARRPSPG